MDENLDVPNMAMCLVTVVHEQELYIRNRERLVNGSLGSNHFMAPQLTRGDSRSPTVAAKFLTLTARPDLNQQPSSV